MQEASIKDQLVVDGTVKACASVYPTDVWIITAEGTASATRSARFVMAYHEESDRWAVLAWANVGGAVTPVMVLEGWVAVIQSLSSRGIEVTLEDGSTVRAKPQSTCACGSRLRTWAPWGDDVRLVAVPKPDITTVVAEKRDA